MRLFCNFLIGLPLFGLFTGTFMLIFESFSRHSSYWLKGLRNCQEPRQWFVNEGGLLEDMTSNLLLSCDLPNGALVILASLLVAILSIPTATFIARVKKF